MEQLSLRSARRLIEKLRVQNGDILVVKLGSSLAEMDNINKLAEALAARGFQRSLVIVAENPRDLTSLDEEEMNKQGWYRIEALKSRIMKKEPNAESSGADI